MRQWVVRVAILVKDVSIGEFFFQTLRNAYVGLGTVEGSLRWCTNYSGVQSFEDCYFLSGHFFRQRDDSLVALNSSNKGEANSSDLTISIPEPPSFRTSKLTYCRW